MIIEKDYRLIDGNFFILGFYNPSPGNPEIKSFDFDDNFLFAIWEDGDKTKTKIDSIEVVYDKKNKKEEIGIYLWFGENNIYLMKTADKNEYGEAYDEDDDEGESTEDGLSSY